jgi:Trk-type K+ transport system membrane component
VFLGSIGFPVIFTLWRHHFHVRRWSLHAKLTLITTVILFFVGAAVFLLLEYDNPKTFGGMDAWDTTFQAFFLSAMTRSGGFSIVDIGQLNGSSLVVGSMLMFVGGGSASTAGGIKVTTLAVLALAVWSEAKGRPSVQAFGRRIPATCSASRSVVAWGATIVAVSTITIARSRSAVEYVLFDVVSGFATVGLSTGSPDLPTRRLRPRGDDVHGARWYSDLAAAVAATADRSTTRCPWKGRSLVEQLRTMLPSS